MGRTSSSSSTTSTPRASADGRRSVTVFSGLRMVGRPQGNDVVALTPQTARNCLRRGGPVIEVRAPPPQTEEPLAQGSSANVGGGGAGTPAPRCLDRTSVIASDYPRQGLSEPRVKGPDNKATLTHPLAGHQLAKGSSVGTRRLPTVGYNKVTPCFGTRRPSVSLHLREGGSPRGY